TVWAAAVRLGEPARAEPGGLSRQEAQALVMLAQGRTDAAIANALGVSTRTARRITHGLLLRLDARSRFQAGVQAVRGGYLPPRT
ncbi:MAG TPA: helix-turn-helix transcriptional regulator, partial [Actinospica sp.]|nr:helix-turn-helix transcriptional regulator [Actinospica sp.]